VAEDTKQVFALLRLGSGLIDSKIIWRQVGTHRADYLPRLVNHRNRLTEWRHV
jgi:hypothetical protein